jgi:hypothetical protein
MMATFTDIQGCVCAMCVPLYLSQHFHMGDTLKKIMQDVSIGFFP